MNDINLILRKKDHIFNIILNSVNFVNYNTKSNRIFINHNIYIYIYSYNYINSD